MRWGWPERVGGRGGSPMLRTELGAALAARDLADPGLYSLVEVLAPTLIDFAPPELATEVVPRLLSGDEVWCQGFSEPESGSDLASLALPRRARRTGGAARSWVINGQKVWTSLAQYADRCVLLTRTGSDRIAPPRHHRVLRRHGQPGDHRRADRDDQRGARVRRGVLRRRRGPGRPGARRGRRRLGRRHEHPPLRALIVLLAAHRVPLSPAAAARRGSGRRRPHRRGSSATRSCSCTSSAPARAPRNTGSPAARRSAQRRRSTRCSSRRPSRRSTTPCAGSCPGSSRSTTRAAGEVWRTRVPVLACRDDLRRHRRGAAQHHRPPAPRSRQRRLMDAAERALLDETVRDAIAGARAPQARDRRARGLGWLEMLEAEPRDAVAVVFTRSVPRTPPRPCSTTCSWRRSATSPGPTSPSLLPQFASWHVPVASTRARRTPWG